jgi:hypothetical protein
MEKIKIVKITSHAKRVLVYRHTQTRADVIPTITFRKQRTGPVHINYTGPNWKMLREDLRDLVEQLSIPILHSMVGLPMGKEKKAKQLGFRIFPERAYYKEYKRTGWIEGIPRTWQCYDGSIVPVYIEVYV